MPDKMPEDMPDRMPKDMMPDRMPEDLPDRMSGDMPDRMPDRMPEEVMLSYFEAYLRSQTTCSFSFRIEAQKKSQFGQIWAILKLCWAYVGRFDAHVGPMLGHVDRVLGLRWAGSCLCRAISKLCGACVGPLTRCFLALPQMLQRTIQFGPR
jgi:hypothetical protein